VSIKLYSKDDTVFYVPRPILDKYPKLPAPRAGQIRGLNITTDAMHVLIHHLFTNTYQCLQSKGTTKHEKVAAEFVTAVRAYALSREYEISSLGELARVEMQRLGNELHFSTVFSLVQDAYPVAYAEDSWFASFLKARLTQLLLHPSESKRGISSMERKRLSLSDLLLRCLMELAESQCLRVYDPDAASKPGVTDNFTFRMPIPELGLQGCPRTPRSDTEISCGLELVAFQPHEHESDLDYGSPTPEPDAEPVEPVKPEAEFFDDETEPAYNKMKKTKKMKRAEKAEANKAKRAAEEDSALGSVKIKESDEAPPDEWSLCASEGREIHMNCSLRAQHVLEGGWNECGSCRVFVDRLHQNELAQRCE
jgi:hypothetical protein